MARIDQAKVEELEPSIGKVIEVQKLKWGEPLLTGFACTITRVMEEILPK